VVHFGSVAGKTAKQGMGIEAAYAPKLRDGLRVPETYLSGEDVIKRTTSRQAGLRWLSNMSKAEIQIGLDNQSIFDSARFSQKDLVSCLKGSGVGALGSSSLCWCSSINLYTTLPQSAG
jgi:hypothetical protein